MCLALIATATVLPPLASRALAATSCTGWKNSYQPPPTIRVLRSYGAASGTVQTVNFRAYVDNVLSWEWPSTYPTAALRAGAIAVKQYGWYYTLHYRGGATAAGACYDVKDTTADQIYRPETRSASATQTAASADTWALSVRRTNGGLSGQFIMTGYRPGTIATCGAEQNGFLLYQKGVADCGKQGKTLEEIQRIYYGATLQPIDPSSHQIGDWSYGDAAAVMPATTGVDAYVRYSRTTSFVTAASPTHIAIDDTATLGRVSADVNGDGLDDLVVLVADGTTQQHIAVLPATGTGYGAPVTWWDSTSAATAFKSTVGGLPGIRLLAGDFDADLITDIALVVTGTDPTTATVYRLRSKKSGFDALLPLYTGPLNPAASRYYAADATGDGRADIVIEADLGAAGLAYSVLPSRRDGLLGDPLSWYAGTDLQRATTLSMVTDFDRDGREDLVLAVRTATGFTFRLLRATGTAFTAKNVATSTIAFANVKLGSGDYNGDAFGDVVVFQPLAAGGSRLSVFLSSGSLYSTANWLDDPALTWTKLRPY
jgi:hypothetical protein